MKIYKKIALTLSVVIATSCTLDLREDPNAVQPNQALPSLVLNSIQRNLAVLFENASSRGAEMTRLENAGSSLYQTSVTPEGVNGLWSTAYAVILQDCQDLIKQSDKAGYARHAGIARIIQAYTLLLMVDSFGDVPFSKAFQGDGNFNPALDDAAALYTRAIQMLDTAKLDLLTPLRPVGYQNPVFPAITDMYYGNGVGATITFPKWVKLANTLKLKIYLNLRSMPGSTSQADIQALINEAPPTGGFITAANENFIFRYGTSTSDPDARHPKFIANYPSGGGDYMSNWLMWHMYHGYDAVHRSVSDPGDPRIRFYMYRQVAVNSTSTNEIRCLGESLPSHYPSSTGSAILDNVLAGRPPMGVGPSHPTNDPTDPAWNTTFCFPTNVGYWGRDHVNPQGIPPDAFLRTAWGSYPAGGRFDGNNYLSVGPLSGQRGAGFQPIMMRSYVSFMLAEARLFMTLTGPAAVAHFQQGIDDSFIDVRDWAVNGTYSTTTVAAAAGEGTAIGTFYPSAQYTTDRTNYRNAAVAAFSNRLLVSATEAMNYVAREYWIALHGNGVEAYNLYRRTGQPTGMQPVLNATPGPFPRSFWYPANAANLNSAITQKSDMSTKVFWDQNTSILDF